MNSFYILLAFLAFTLFGYLSLVRILYKFQYAKNLPSFDDWRSAVGTREFFSSLPQALLFISLPSLSLLLYWGWGPALLWLAISHLLVDTLVNFIRTSRSHEPALLNDHYLSYSSIRNVIRVGLSQLALMLLVSVVVVFLANMIDQQAGVLFALVGVLVNIQFLRTASGALDTILKLVPSIGFLMLGLTLAHQMGISIFGNWAPLPNEIPWLKFDNRSILALFLLVASVQLSQSASLYKGISTLVSFIVIALLLILVGSLVWQQPLLDAPLLSSNGRDITPPAYIMIILLISTTSMAILSQLATSSRQEATTENLEKSFLLQQTTNLILLVFSVAICLWLASAGGIGAWNTHYSDWSEGVTLQKHFSLVLKTMAFANGVQTSSTGLPFTLLVIGLCLFGLSTLITLLAILKIKTSHAERANAQENTLTTKIAGMVNVQYSLIFVFCCWLLSNGVPVHLWMLMMALFWLMICDVLLVGVATLEKGTLASLLARGFVVVLTCTGGVQILWASIQHLLKNQFSYGFAYCLILMITLILTTPSFLACIKDLRDKPDGRLFQSE